MFACVAGLKTTQRQGRSPSETYDYDSHTLPGNSTPYLSPTTNTGLEICSEFLIIQITAALLTSDPYSKTSPPVSGMMRSPKLHFRSKQKDLLSRKRNDALGQCRISDPNRKTFLPLRGILILSWSQQPKKNTGANTIHTC